MKPIAVPAPLVAKMKSHARETYPDECCGFLIGPAFQPEGASQRTVSALERARNEFDGERRRRFLIRPDELQALERRLEPTGRVVVGFYHSHPDHPARPSEFDRENAWPWYSYIVLAVTASDVPGWGAFELEPESAAFQEVDLEVIEDSLSAPPVAGG